MKSDIGAIHSALTAAGVDIAGVSMPPEVHETHGPATFVQCENALYRVDWKVEPLTEQIELAVSTLGAGCAVVGIAPVPSHDTRAFIPPPDRDD